MIHRFLSITKPVSGQALVIESWFPDHPAMREAVARVREGRYQVIVCVGGPADVRNPVESTSYAELAAARLIALGVDPTLVAVARATSGPHRTYRSAVTACDWLRRMRPDITSVDVFTLGAHARKSHVLFRKAFGPGYRLGIIAGRERYISRKTWWRSRIGWYVVLRNVVGCVYAVMLNPNEVARTGGSPADPAKKTSAGAA